MAGVRNGPLARAVLASAGWWTLGTVPPEWTWLLKTVHVLNPGPVNVTVQVHLQAVGDAVTARLPTLSVSAGEAGTWEGWTTLGPGDSVRVYTDQGGCHVWCSGAELPGAIEPRDLPSPLPSAALPR